MFSRCSLIYEKDNLYLSFLKKVKKVSYYKNILVEFYFYNRFALKPLKVNLMKAKQKWQKINIGHRWPSPLWTANLPSKFINGQIRCSLATDHMTEVSVVHLCWAHSSNSRHKVWHYQLWFGTLDPPWIWIHSLPSSVCPLGRLVDTLTLIAFACGNIRLKKQSPPKNLFLHKIFFCMLKISNKIYELMYSPCFPPPLLSVFALLTPLWFAEYHTLGLLV